MSALLDKAREVFDIEIEGLQTVRNNLNEQFEALVDRCGATIDCGGKLVLTGIGKSGYIAKKITATLSSLGSPSVFIHPVEAMHGDLGIMQKNDILIAVSYSGETEELLSILSPAKRLGLEIIAVTGNSDSRLARVSNLVVNMNVPREACPFNLAPTTTTTALLALGDALAIVLLHVRGFTKEDYGRLHPGGAIGRAVTMRACDIMRSGERLALVTPEVMVKDSLLRMTQARCGSAIVVDAAGRMLGIFTDGDFRRQAEKDIGVLNRKVSEVMTASPVSVKGESLAVEVLKLIESKKINEIIVLDEDGRVSGMIDVQDLPGFKLM